MRLRIRGQRAYILDGDQLRAGLSRDLGFSATDRAEQVRRAAHVAKMFVEAGVTPLVSLISPYENDRQLARSMFVPGDFIEVFVDTPADECERRDPKGLYALARAGRLQHLSGLNAPYEPPAACELRLQTVGTTPGECADRIVALLG
jgi:adenylyl-sulfate kinase